MPRFFLAVYDLLSEEWREAEVHKNDYVLCEKAVGAYQKAPDGRRVLLAGFESGALRGRVEYCGDIERKPIYVNC